MTGLTGESWFWWAVLLILAAPLLLVALSELVDWLEYRGSAFARPVRFLRTIVLPIAWLILLVTKVADENSESQGVRLVATVLGFCLMLLALSLLNAGLFAGAERHSWRARLPTIFVDLARVLMIVIGSAILLSVVWGVNVGGLVAALGVTSIVIGLALQNAVVSVVAGLLLLFEQPFEKGDWLDVGGTVGRVVEVNWRSLHLDVGNAIQIVPNGSLAGASFANLSRPTGKHSESVELEFASDEPPNAVKAMLDRTAAELPGLDPGSRPSTVIAACGESTITYSTSFTVADYTLRGRARDTFLTRAWYGARREGLRLVGLEAFHGDEPDRVADALAAARPQLRLSDEDVEALAPLVRVEEFAAGEAIIRPGQVPAGMRYVLAGRADLEIESPVLGTVALESLGVGDYFGQRILTRDPARSSVIARRDLEVLLIPQEALRRVLDRNFALARDLEEVRERRNDAERDAIAGTAVAMAIANGDGAARAGG